MCDVCIGNAMLDASRKDEAYEVIWADNPWVWVVSFRRVEVA